MEEKKSFAATSVEKKREKEDKKKPRKAKREKSKPKFKGEKKLIKNHSFSRQYRIFRQGGLGVIDSFFNSLYILMSEKSVEKEKERIFKEGEGEVHERHFLELHALPLRLFSAVFRKIYGFGAFFASFWQKRDGSHTHHSKIRYIKDHASHIVILVLALFVAGYIAFFLRYPVVLRAEIDGEIVGIVENKNVVDSAINELEDNVERILGERFTFPYEIQYTFRRQKSETITPKNKISEELYTYILDSICTAGGLYIDDTLVAVCNSEEEVEDALSQFISIKHTGAESGIFNDVRIITQAYPTDCIITSDQLTELLMEMSKPLEERKKENLTDHPPLVDPLKKEEEEVIPVQVLVSDIDSLQEENTAPLSNRPQSISGIKLDLYSATEISYQAKIPYRTVYQESNVHYTSMADITTRGSDGLSQVRARVYYVNGKEARREILSESVIRQPVDRVISIGTKLLPEDQGITSFAGSPGRFIPPNMNEVFSYYGAREDGFHRGWDIPGEEGDNIYASASGTVVVAFGQNGNFSQTPGNYYTGYGYCVVLQHEGGYSTMYAHCSKICVTLGQKVKQGDKIAEIGNTGVSEGNHVHFEISMGATKIDPKKLLYKGNKTIYD